MPEIVEVELIRRQLAVLENAHVVSVNTDSNPRFTAAALTIGHSFGLPQRKGKWLSIPLINLDTGLLSHLGIHLGMTGQLTLLPPAEIPNKWRSRFEFEDGRVLFHSDLRGFGRVLFLPTPFYGMNLGIEPTDPGFSVALRKLCGNGGSPVFLSLLRQHLVSGIGSYIAQESLWRSSISPFRRDLDEESITILASSIERVVHDSLLTGGMTMRDFRHLDGSKGQFFDKLDCYGRNGLPCRRCGYTLQKDRIGGRGVSSCKFCQN